VAQGRETIDDVASVLGGDHPPVPGVILVASGREPTRRVLAEGAIHLTLGRSIATSSGRLSLDDGRMSREHASIERVGNDWIIRDLASRNGTFVDGERIVDQVQVRGDAVVRCGHTVFLLLADAREQDRDHDIGDWVIGPELARVLGDVRRHAAAPTLLVHGESGAGVELVARHYHQQGPRASGPFVAVDCAAIPEGAAERLLFGDAASAAGYLQNAAGGTLFLDEIAELDLAVQAKLLRAVESREVTPVGASTPIRVDAGVVAASHRDLRGAVASRRFRGDLYHRLAHPVVEVPPLRQRRGDIPLIVSREVAQVDRGLAIHPRLVEICCARPWPGNVRELQRAVREAAEAAVAAGRDVVRPEDLALVAGVTFSDEPSGPITATGSGMSVRPRVSPAEVDRAAVEAALEASAGNVSAAARSLGLHRTQLYRLLQRFGMARPPGDETGD
jgi:DNA-binding NtrC family response regulator